MASRAYFAWVVLHIELFAFLLFLGNHQLIPVVIIIAILPKPWANSVNWANQCIKQGEIIRASVIFYIVRAKSDKSHIVEEQTFLHLGIVELVSELYTRAQEQRTIVCLNYAIVPQCCTCNYSIWHLSKYLPKSYDLAIPFL